MMDAEEIEQLLTNKLDLLCLEREDTQYILRNGNVNEVRNQIQYYEQLLNETRDLQRSAKRAKLAKRAKMGLPSKRSKSGIKK